MQSIFLNLHYFVNKYYLYIYSNMSTLIIGATIVITFTWGSTILNITPTIFLIVSLLVFLNICLSKAVMV